MTSSGTAPGTRDRADHDAGGRARALTADEKRVTVLLGVPTLALALAVTLVTTYLPVVAQGFVGSRLVIGLIVGIEGLIALWLPLPRCPSSRQSADDRGREVDRAGQERRL